MSEMKPNDSASTDEGEERDWAAAKAFFENLQTNKPRPAKARHAVTVAVSSLTLFDMEAEQRIYNEKGIEKYEDHQVQYEEDPLKQGPAFQFVKALMNVNARLRELYPDSEELFDIVLITDDHAQVGMRLKNSIIHYDLTIEKICMTGGVSPIGYLKAYMTNLYLSEDPEKVTKAIEEGVAAAMMFVPQTHTKMSDTQLRVAFDGDAEIFYDDLHEGHEKEFENKPPAQGTLKCFLVALGKLQKKFYAKDQRMSCPIRTFLVSAGSSGFRVLKTLRSWGLHIDEAVPLALLQNIKPHIYFDDQMFHIERDKEPGTISAH